jgi:tape measure domain-containing protein
VATPIGEAVVRILADSSAFDRAVSKLGSNTAKSLEAGTRGLSTRAADIGEKFGSTIGRVAGTALKRGLQVAAVGVAAAVGTVLVKGFKRFTTIEDATKSLTVLLGDAAKAAALVGKTLKVVEGTPFSLDGFIQATQRMVASGLEVERIPPLLTAVADAAAALGGGSQQVADDITTSFAQIAVSATLSLQEIRALEDKGVPALKILANQAGVTADEMKDRISSGAVDASEALDQLVDGIENGTDGLNGMTAALKGQAQQTGNLSAEWANLQIAIARAGAKIIGAFGDVSKSGNAFAIIVRSLRDTIDVLGDVGVRVAEKIAGSRGFGRVLAFFEALPGKVEAAAASLEGKSFGEAVSSLLGRVDFGKVADRITDGLLKAFEALPHQRISEVITRFIIAGISAVAENAAQITAAIVAAAPQIVAGVLSGLVKAFTANPIDFAVLVAAMGLPGIGKIVTSVLAGIFEALPGGAIISSLIRSLGGALQKAFTSLFAFVFGPNLIGRVGFVLSNFFSGLGSAILNAIPRLVASIGTGVGAVVSGALGAVLLAILDPKLFGDIAGTIIRFFFELPGKIGNAIAAIDWSFVGKAVLTGIATGFGGSLGLVVAAITGVGRAIINAFKSLLGIGSPSTVFVKFGQEIMAGLLNGLLSSLGRVLGFFRALPGQILRLVAGLPGQLQRLGAAAMSAMARGVTSAAGAVLGFFAGLPGRIAGALGSLGGLLYSAGRSAMSGLFRGIVDGAQAVYNYVAGIARRIASLKGPLDKDRKLLVPAGEAIMEGLNNAIQGKFGALQNTVSQIAGVIGGGVPIGRFPTQIATRATTTAAVPSGVIQNITVNEVAQDPQATAEAVAMRVGRMVNT